MADVVTAKKRSEIMAGIRSRNTNPEILIRKSLHRKGFRYRLHVKSLPGKPDLVLPKHNTVIQIHGCFWHMHECHLFKWPSSRTAFWNNKLTGNKERDLINNRALLHMGWRLLIIWECAIKGKGKRSIEDILIKTENFIFGSETFKEITGIKN